MLKNKDYNIIEMIAEDSKTLHRVDTYVADSKECGPCQEVWKKIRDNREQELADLMSLLREHVEQPSRELRIDV